jgi:SAM-dependent methyltransferase
MEGVMSEPRYFAHRAADAVERERRELAQQVADPLTRRRLERLGIAPGWRCLDVGAGAGSVARWLAAKVGPTGWVVATDINPRFLGDVHLPNLEVWRHDIEAEELETAHYDLVHCRAVLMHLAHPEQALLRMAMAVRPGGWLCLEETDWTSFGAADPAHPAAAAFTRRSRALIEYVHATGMVQVDFGRRLRRLIEHLGFVEVGHEGVTWIRRGGEPAARLRQLAGHLLRAAIIQAGVLTAEECKANDQLLTDPSFTFVDVTSFAAWGRRPGSPGAAAEGEHERSWSLTMGVSPHPPHRRDAHDESPHDRHHED